jgi:cullin 3
VLITDFLAITASNQIVCFEFLPLSFSCSLFLPLQFKIEPFKHPLKLDPDYAGTSCPSFLNIFALSRSATVSHASFYFSAEKTWKFLENAIHEINNRNSSGLSFEELHR